MLLCGLDLAILGLGRYDCKPWRPWVMWLGGLHGCIDDGGTGKLTLSAALSDLLLNFLEDVSDVKGQMVRRGRHHRDLCPSLGELPFEDGQRQLRSDLSLPREDVHHSKRIKLAAEVVSLPYHHPFNVAQRMVQLDYMTGGRVIFGSGPGARASDGLRIGAPV